MPEAVIVSAVRSPIGRATTGSLRDVRPDDLAATVIRAALDTIPQLSPDELDDLYLGTAEPCGEQGSNLARVVTVLLGLDRLPAVTINRFCASSVQTTRMAFHAIRADEGEAFVSAGVDCVSRYRTFTGTGQPAQDTGNPRFAEATARTARSARTHQPWADPRESGQLPDVYIAMGQAAENVARLRGINRRAQDEWAVISQNRASEAQSNGTLAREITPITLPGGRVFHRDDSPRAGVTLEDLQALHPMFREDGTVTAGNCSPLNDGAAALVVMSDTRAQELDLPPLARVVSTGACALSPEIMGLGPVDASRQALTRAGMSISDIDLVEMNEAFAAQVLPSAEDLGVDHERLNVHGGAIALGHPFGMTGARITATLLNALRTHDGQFGLEAMGVAGGQGMAIIYERLS